MERTAKSKAAVLEIARLLADHMGEDTTVLFVGAMSDWTDYFVVTSARSQAHLSGLMRRLNEYFAQHGIEPLNPHKSVRDRGWVLIDCGDFVIHLMEKQQREFYELERLWFKAEVVDYSSDSS